MPSAAAPPQFLKVKGDGRCLFRAVHRAVIGCTGENRYSNGQHESEAEEVQEKEHADMIRALMVGDMVEQNDLLVAQLGDDNVEEYIAKVSEATEYGDYTCCTFLPSVVHRPLMVWAKTQYG